MRWVRMQYQGQVFEGEWIGEVVKTRDGREFRSADVQWLPPVVPTKIIGLALNYRDHAAELGLPNPDDPALFFKPLSSLTGHLAPVYYPAGATHCHYETEVAVVMDRTCRGVAAEQALDYVRGYTIANDFTCRDFIRNTFRPPVRAKGYDSFCPLGPALVTKDSIKDPDVLEIVTRVNGEVRQSGNTRHLLLAIPDIIAYLTSFMTLEPGDVILTGTPKGISPVYPGDQMACEIEGLGILVNPVAPGLARVGNDELTRRKS